MKKKQKIISLIILVILLLVIGFFIIRRVIIQNDNKAKEKIAFDDVYWEVQSLYGGDNKIVDLVNDDDYYTINIYDKETNLLIRSFKMNAYTGETEQVGANEAEYHMSTSSTKEK